MYVLLDSNIWIKELGLSSNLGSAARYFFNTQGAKVVLPEVVEWETERHLRASLNRFVAELRNNHSKMLTVFGQLKELVLPDKAAIDTKVASIFGDCKVALDRRPFTLESARDSLLRTIDKIPPSDKNQQFKDGVIWAECLRLLDHDDVFLVTDDRAFYEDQKTEKGLSKALVREAENKSHQIQLFPSLSDLLVRIRSEVSIDERALFDELWPNVRGGVETMLAQQNFTTIGTPTVRVELYFTEDPNRLYCEFNVTYECEDLSGEGRTDAILRFNGDCSYLAKEMKFGEFRSGDQELWFKTSDGEERAKKNVSIRIQGIIMGHRTVKHTVKYQLDS